jgi:hypothetical protein
MRDSAKEKGERRAEREGAARLGSVCGRGLTCFGG